MGHETPGGGSSEGLQESDSCQHLYSAAVRVSGLSQWSGSVVPIRGPGQGSGSPISSSVILRIQNLSLNPPRTRTLCQNTLRPKPPTGLQFQFPLASPESASGHSGGEAGRVGSIPSNTKQQTGRFRTRQTPDWVSSGSEPADTKLSEPRPGSIWAASEVSGSSSRRRCCLISAKSASFRIKQVLQHLVRSHGQKILNGSEQI